MYPLWGIKSLLSNMGTMSGIEVGEVSFSLKLNNIFSSSIAIMYLHPHLSPSFKAITGCFYCYLPHFGFWWVYSKNVDNSKICNAKNNGSWFQNNHSNIHVKQLHQLLLMQQMRNFYDKCVFLTRIYHVITQSHITFNLSTFNLTQAHKI